MVDDADGGGGGPRVKPAQVDAMRPLGFVVVRGLSTDFARGFVLVAESRVLGHEHRYLVAIKFLEVFDFYFLEQFEVFVHVVFQAQVGPRYRGAGEELVERVFQEVAGAPVAIVEGHQANQKNAGLLV